MILDDSVIYERIQKVFQSGENPVYFNYEIEIVAGGETHKVFNVLSVVEESNYVGEFMSFVTAEVQMYHSMLRRSIQPNSDKLVVKLTKTPVGLDGTHAQGEETITRFFDAYLMNDKNQDLMGSNVADATDEQFDAAGLATVFLELVEQDFVNYKLIESYGNYRDCSVTDILRGLMTRKINGRTFNVDMVEGDNETVYKQFRIPAKIPLEKLPRFIQEANYGGVYSSSIGYFHRNAVTYIYPLLNYSRFDDTKRTLTILNIPSTEMVGVDNTYHLDKDALFVLSTGDIDHSDITEIQLHQKGNAVRYALSGNLIDTFSTIEDGVDIVPEQRNRKEHNFEERPRGLNKFTSPDRFFTDNVWAQSSKVTGGLGTILNMGWSTANIDLLYPGMPTKVIYKRNGEVHALYGTLTGAVSDTQSTEGSPIDKRYVSSVAMSFHCERVV